LYFETFKDVREREHEREEEPRQRIARSLEGDPESQQNRKPGQHELERDVGEQFPEGRPGGADRKHDGAYVRVRGIGRTQLQANLAADGRVAGFFEPVAQSTIRLTVDGEDLIALADAGILCALLQEVDGVSAGLGREQRNRSPFVAEDVA